MTEDELKFTYIITKLNETDDDYVCENELIKRYERELIKSINKED